MPAADARSGGVTGRQLEEAGEGRAGPRLVAKALVGDAVAPVEPLVVGEVHREGVERPQGLPRFALDHEPLDVVEGVSTRRTATRPRRPSRRARAVDVGARAVDGPAGDVEGEALACEGCEGLLLA